MNIRKMHLQNPLEFILALENNIKEFESFAKEIDNRIRLLDHLLSSGSGIELMSTGSKSELKTETDYLSELEHNIKKAYESLEHAISKSACSICREVLNKIKDLPLSDQLTAVSELKTYMNLAEKGDVEEMEKYLKNTSILKSLVKQLMLGDG